MVVGAVMDMAWVVVVVVCCGVLYFLGGSLGGDAVAGSLRWQALASILMVFVKRCSMGLMFVKEAQSVYIKFSRLTII